MPDSVEMFKEEWLAKKGLPLSSVYFATHKKWGLPIMNYETAILFDRDDISEVETKLFLEAVETMEALLCQ